MTTTTHLLRQRRFLPLFVTQLLGAFNDNLYKNAMVLYVVYSLYNSEAEEARFSAIASAAFIVPFVALSALAGQLADLRDKAGIIRIVKACEIGIMAVGAGGLFMAWQGVQVTTIAIPLMLAALFAMGLHSTFFGPIKYAILPQHLHPEEVLAGTGMVEAGTYIAILAGTILAGWIPVEAAAVTVVVTALLGFFAGRQVPSAPPQQADRPLEFPLLRPFLNHWRNPLARALGFLPVLLADQGLSAWRLVRNTLHYRPVFLAIMSISFFWTIGAVLFIQFPPLAKNVLDASKEVASLFLVVFSVGVAIGSVAINRMLKGKVSARFAPASVLVMGLFIVAFHVVCQSWTPHPTGTLLDAWAFVAEPLAVPLLLSLLGIAVAGGMFVVPLYAFLTTMVDKAETARTIAANNVVNSFAMAIGAVLAMGLSAAGVSIVNQLLLSAAMCLVSALLGWLLHKAELAHPGEIGHSF
ncbi:MFS transporter [Novosphingobium cyanobacteriorum]|uniref:MFS transporter n=1 Tax=Novosphingobium cyanobacteriorum TaxID=3024215 RepID=A0ABT6CNH7_9SPHN|nr:MFS transporter [Novosphingobium cyanobacteriorum]MDF8334803.1 MFS transporter [Novosphingobium cyanobacteriorum]